MRLGPIRHRSELSPLQLDRLIEDVELRSIQRSNPCHNCRSNGVLAWRLIDAHIARVEWDLESIVAARCNRRPAPKVKNAKDLVSQLRRDHSGGANADCNGEILVGVRSVRCRQIDWQHGIASNLESGRNYNAGDMGGDRAG